MNSYRVTYGSQSTTVSADNAQQARERAVLQMGVEPPAGVKRAMWLRNFRTEVLEEAPAPRDPNVAPAEFRGQPVLAAIKHVSPRFAPTWYVVVKGDCFFEVYNPQGHRCGIGETLEEATKVARRESGSMHDEHKSSLDFGH